MADGGDHINVRTVGSGPTVLLFHGGMTTAAQTWAKQEELAERWTLLIPDRRGFEPNPPVDRVDFEVDAADIVRLLDGHDEPAHLVGHSYGALGVLYAAALRPERVKSVTVIEPPAHGIARGHPGVEQQIAEHLERIETIHDPTEFMRAFLGALGAPTDGVPSPLPPQTERLVRLLMSERPPWEAELPIDALRARQTRVLVVSGGHSPTLDMLAAALANAIGPAARHTVITGRGHVVQRIGEPFNRALEAFLTGAEPRRHI